MREGRKPEYPEKTPDDELQYSLPISLKWSVRVTSATPTGQPLSNLQCGRWKH